MIKILIDSKRHVVYQHMPTASLITFDVTKGKRIRRYLSENGGIFHQVPEDVTFRGELLKFDPKTDSYILSGDFKEVRLRDLDYLPLFIRISLDIKSFFGLKVPGKRSSVFIMSRQKA
jgi:hypothetical protein